MPGTSIIDSLWPRLPLLNVQLPESREEVDSIGSHFSWKGQQFFLRNSHIFWVWVCLFLHSGTQPEQLWGAYIVFNALVTLTQSRDSTAKVMWEWVSDHCPFTYHASQVLPCWGSVGTACRRTSSEAVLWEGSFCWDSPPGIAVNSITYLWHHRTWQITQLVGRAASTMT